MYNQPPYSQQQQPQQQQAYNPQYQQQQQTDPFFLLANEMNATKGWIKFIGIVLIVMGAIYGLTIIGLVVAWLPIWMGIILTNAAKHIESYVQTRSFTELIEYSRKIKSYFAILGVLSIIGLIGMAIWIIIIIIAISTVGLQGLQFYRF
ncbi:MAG TPA: DUF5362 family protein [Bacteroidales bacterium]|nr:DUF5362 family protein [Bacteroidales bacterium]